MTEAALTEIADVISGKSSKTIREIISSRLMYAMADAYGRGLEVGKAKK